MSPTVRGIITATGLLLLVGSAFLVLSQSSFYPNSIQYPDTESSLYLYAGSQLLDGNMPYRDIFDFHAPLIFLIDALGLLISDSFGVWLIELHFLVATLLIIFAVLKDHTGPITAVLTCLILASLIGFSLRGGNHIEEYALLFQALALAGFIDCIARRRLTLLSIYLIGISLSLMFWLKPLLTVFWLPFIPVIIALLIKQEGVGIALTRLLTIIFSAALAFVVIMPWLYMSNALTSCYEQVALFYRDCLALITRQQQLETLRYFAGRLPFVLILSISLAVIVRGVLLWRGRRLRQGEGGVEEKTEGKATDKATDKATGKATLSHLLFESNTAVDEEPFGRNTRLLIITNLIAALLILLTMTVAGRMDEHAALQGLIALVIPLAYLIHLCVRGVFCRALPRRVFGLILIAFLMLSLSAPGLWVSVAAALEQQQISRELAERQDVIAEVRALQDEEAPLIVFGDDCWIYTAADSWSATRYAYQPFSESFRADLNADFYRQVKIADSLLLIGRRDEGLIEHYPGITDYEPVFQNQHYEIYRKIEALGKH
jgi:hypothetical protein